MSSTLTTLSTSGLQLRRGSRAWRTGVELLSSMRFAIALLVVVAVASIIGTVLDQGQPLNNYVDEFGPFWTSVFHRFDLFNVYSSWWFLLILGVLVVSTSLCLVRNTPKILADLRSYKEHFREQGLRALHDKAEASLPLSRAQMVQRVQAHLRRRGYRSRLRESEGATMVAAKTGGINRLGYILAHSAFVFICVGGLLDGDMMIRLQMLLTGKKLLTSNMQISQVPPQNILSVHNPSFRGNLQIPEGGSSNTAVLTIGDGSVLQPLPFTIQLHKFQVDYYSTGMPRLFESQVQITDSRTGKSFPATIKVNSPVTYDGVTIFQSGFDDGGSHLQLRAWPMHGVGDKPLAIDGDVGSSRQLSDGSQSLNLEFTGFRAINVENLNAATQQGQTPVAPRGGLFAGFDKHLGAAVNSQSATHPTNVGPAVIYKLRDAAGQAHEFFNYMLPIELGGLRVFVAGERSELGGSYHYLRIPADSHDSVDDWMRLRAALSDPKMRAKAVEAYVREALPPNASAQLVDQLRDTAGRTLDVFAGVVPKDPATGKPLLSSPGGLPALAEFLQRNVPKEQLTKASKVFIDVLNGTLWQLWLGERAQAGLQPPKQDEASQRYFNAAVLALSDATFYPAPLYMQLAGFKQVQASVFQVARAPGKIIVYFGAGLLILGVFTMLYIRERRAWFLVKDEGEGSSKTLMAMSTNRRTIEFEREFGAMRDAVLQSAAKPAAGGADPT
ncbi:cytochrome c biogenesis protein ResB [Thiomonas sp. FB-6]|uniref:cytochrome c biogenesis protein ResB n=1 Tax=Thiomonas sp. FB-6 TaxID=1158291 RepID=UPI0004757373|nr:cytochrome c biogenesis protein ResB [Thiomonas sp. FB-6]